MGCINSSEARRPAAAVVIISEKDVIINQRIAELTSLEDLLDDVFAAGYMLRFTESEFSSENVAFLLAVRNFEKRAMEHPEEAKQLAKAVKREHIDAGTNLEVNCSGPHRTKTQEQIKSYDKGTIESSHARVVFFDLYRTIHRNVLHDVFPRFKHSKFAAELTALHPAHAFLHDRCREPFAEFLTGTSRRALDFWLAAQEFEASHECLASGWPSGSTVQRASTVLATYESLLTELCAPALLYLIQKQVLEAPFDLYRGAKLVALNALSTQYESFLDGPLGDAFVKELEVTRIPRQKKAAVASSDEYEDAW